jgi:hypothetical protein
VLTGRVRDLTRPATLRWSIPGGSADGPLKRSATVIGTSVRPAKAVHVARESLIPVGCGRTGTVDLARYAESLATSEAADVERD